MVRQEIVDKIRELQQQPDKIRNISVIAHVDHGKSTLTDSLVCAAGLLSKDKAGDALVMDSMKEEKERGITIKSSGISLPFDVLEDEPNPNYNPNWPNPPASDNTDNKDDDDDEKAGDMKEAKRVPYLVNLIDSPGHVDFSPEVTAALRVTDGALVVVDCVEGVCVQTKTVLRQALSERIKPVLFLNKMDRIFFELKMEPEEAYQTLSRAVESVNVVIATYLDEALGDVTVWPQSGSVAFGSGLHGWGFTLKDFAKIWHKQFDMSVKKMTKKLWGDWFYDPKLKKFVSDRFTASGKRLPRAFCQLVLEPLKMLFESMLVNDQDKYGKIMKKFNLPMPVSKDKDEPLEGKKLLKAVMRDWLPASDALLDMIVHKLPSPLVAQKYRVDKLYSGPLDDEVATAIRNCDPNGPLMMYVSKMVPTSDYSRFYAFGRIFSGSVRTGLVVRVQGPNYIPGEDKSDLFVKPVQGTYMMMGPAVESIGSCPCGNTVGLMGIDQYLTKCGTITTSPLAHNFVSMKHSVSPIVRLAVEAANPAQLNKLVQGLKKLVKVDPMVQVSMAETGEHIVSGCGELHLQVCLNTLRNDLMTDVALRVSEPVVSYCESIEAACNTTVCTKSPNKLNRLFLTTAPMGDELCVAIDNGVVTGEMDSKARARILAEEFKWELAEGRKIWCFGAPPNGQANVLVDATKGVQYLHDIKESVCGAFRQQTNSGVYCGEPMRGIRFDITDAKIHPDPPHHGAGQIMPCTRQGLFAGQIGSQPCLLEPMYQCEINVPQSALQGVYQTLRQRRGVIDGAEDTGVGAVSVVKAFLPVKESFGFTESLRQNTSGQAFPTLNFSHWQRMPGALDDVTSLAHETVMQIRARKGMSSDLPQFNDYHQRL